MPKGVFPEDRAAAGGKSIADNLGIVADRVGLVLDLLVAVSSGADSREQGAAYRAGVWDHARFGRWKDLRAGLKDEYRGVASTSAIRGDLFHHFTVNLALLLRPFRTKRGVSLLSPGEFEEVLAGTLEVVERHDFDMPKSFESLAKEAFTLYWRRNARWDRTPPGHPLALRTHELSRVPRYVVEGSIAEGLQANAESLLDDRLDLVARFAYVTESFSS